MRPSIWAKKEVQSCLGDRIASGAAHTGKEIRSARGEEKSTGRANACAVQGMIRGTTETGVAGGSSAGPSYLLDRALTAALAFSSSQTGQSAAEWSWPQHAQIVSNLHFSPWLHWPIPRLVREKQNCLVTPRGGAFAGLLCFPLPRDVRSRFSSRR